MELPPLDTNGAFLTETSREVLSVNTFTLDGDFSYFTQVDPDNLDVASLRMTADNVSGRFFGFLIRYLIILADNYFGDDVDFSTVEEYRINMDDIFVRRNKSLMRKKAKVILAMSILLLC
jgi:hypothetical protein